MKSVPLLYRFSFKIVAGLTCMLFLVGIPFFFIFLHYHQNLLLDALEKSTTSMSRILTQQLEVSALERREHDLNRVVERLAASGDVRSIMVIDSAEKVTVSSDKSLVGRTLRRHTESGCRECHSSVVLKDTIYMDNPAGRPYYRSVNVIQNRPACFGCHDKEMPVNGIFIMDFSQDVLRSQFRSDIVQLLGMGGTMLALTIGVLYLLLNHLVLRRLRRFADAAEEIGHSRFGQVSMDGRDEFSQLAAGFNLMSKRLGSAMKEIQGTKDYLEKVINNIDDEIIVLNRNFEVVTANAAHFRIRREQESHPGDGDTSLEADAGMERHISEGCACASTFHDGRVHKILQTVMRADGIEKHIEVFCSPLKDADGEVHQAIEVRRDITERKLMEANLVHSERLASLGLLASGLSHEINNPLASISAFVEGLKRRLERSGDPQKKDFTGLGQSLDLIQSEIERAKDITQRLLILAQKDESGCSLVDLNESLWETVRLVSFEADKRGIRCEVEPGSNVPIIKTSEAQIRQVFLNLLLNSLQAGHQGGFIHCRTWHENGSALASVEDDGVGIESADLNKIFEPFFSKRTAGQGTGLGLFICRSIVSSWGGDIRVESRAGQGAKFTVRLPVQS